MWEDEAVGLEPEAEDPEAEEKTRYLVAVIYDIANDKRRRCMVKWLERFARRVQLSAFEGRLTRSQAERLARRAARIIHAKEDSLRIYILMDRSIMRAWGRHSWRDEEEDIVIM